ncbi:serine kinase [Croceicoccus ponticola]|uniref:Serine kinase n=1 Tax=Croceicoccus ponticola TaxID=2217664 RepID=A0A437GVM6_9SPHN|nr:HPr kinase/phosphatase C-terminal domain-containing protein [Croceicoccus ponticola]RVQ65949.1 serine kinase [Croceicoccus ponticola]
MTDRPSDAIPHQATCVAIGGRAILIEGEPGCGKTSLALALIDRGAILVGDDGVLLERRGARLWAMPHPNTRGLIEVRNVGIATIPCGEAMAAIVLDLDARAPRHVEVADTVERHGIALPRLFFWPDSPVGAIRAEMALAMHGLTL